MAQDATYSKTLKQNDRLIGYSVVEASQRADRQRAIVFFYPLSGSSLFLHKLAPAILAHQYNCSLVCVDRPGCGATSHLHDHDEEQERDFAIQRIQGHASDVRQVLNQEGIREVYLLGICIGHPYAIEVCRQLWNESDPNHPATVVVKGITLVAPFVSTACGDSWWVARMGNAVPRCVLNCAVGSLVALGTVVIPHVVKPSAIKHLIEKQEEEHLECQWTDKDYEEMCQYALQTTTCTREAKQIEARLGASSSWQAEICDKFAVESGYGINGKVDADPTEKVPPVPIKIHACFKDKVATLPSVMWVADRCYGGANIIEIEQNIQSHEMMTFLGGPFRNPLLLHRIAQAWGLLQIKELDDDTSAHAQ